MDRLPSPEDLAGAGTVAQALAYAVGLAGAVAGAVVLREGETVIAVTIWVVTFAVGALLMVAALLARAMAGLVARLSRIESDLSVVVADGGERGGWAPTPRVEGGTPEGWG